MANSKSAEKRIQVNERNRLRNKVYKSTIKTVCKKCLVAIENLSPSNEAQVTDLIALSYSKIDKAVKKRILHPNTGAARKAALIRALKKAQENRK
nr:ribosomal protein S20 [Proteomonas sp. NIES-1005]